MTRLIAVTVAAALSGCGHGPDFEAPGAGPELALPEVSNRWMRRLVNTDNGLELRRWVFADDPDRIAAVVMHYRDGQALQAGRDSALRRNGMRLVRVRADQLDDLLADLGVPALEVTAWHGQIYAWRELQKRPIEPGGMALAVDGRVRRYESGSVQLKARCWTVPMEDGPNLNLQLVPQFASAEASTIRHQLGGQVPAPVIFQSMALEIQLQAGFAYVLTAESPGASGTDGDEGSPSTRQQPDADSVQQTPHRRIGPVHTVGPGVDAPATVGELLFGNQTNPRRCGMLVFVPQFAPELFPPDPVTADTRAPQDGAIHAASNEENN